MGEAEREQVLKAEDLIRKLADEMEDTSETKKQLRQTVEALDALQETLQESSQTFRKETGRANEQALRRIADAREHLQKLRDGIEEDFERIENQFAAKVEAATQMFTNKASETHEKSMKALGRTQDNLMEMGESIENRFDAMQHRFVARVEEAQKAFRKDAAEANEKSREKLRQIGDNLAELGDDLRDSFDSMEKQLSAISDALSSAVKTVSVLHDLLSDQPRMMRDIQDDLRTEAESRKEATDGLTQKLYILGGVGVASLLFSAAILILLIVR